MPPPVAQCSETSQVVAENDDGISETAVMTARIILFAVAHYRQENLVLCINLMNESELPLHDFSDAHVRSVVKSFRVNGFDKEIENFFITVAIGSNSLEECDGASLNTSEISGHASFVVLQG